jgi:hypothetical protein
MLVNETLAVDAEVSGRAVTEKVPAMQFRVQVTSAVPFVSVIAKDLDKVQDAPLVGTAKSTRTLGIGRPLASRTVARTLEPLAVI